MKHRIAVLTGSLLLLATPALAQTQTTADTLHALDQCGSIVDEHQRLSCFDGLGPQVKAALMRMPGAHAGPPTAQEQKNWFGFDLGSLFASSPAQQTTPDKFGSEAMQNSQPPQAAGEPRAAGADRQHHGQGDGVFPSRRSASSSSSWTTAKSGARSRAIPTRPISTAATTPSPSRVHRWEAMR